VTAKVLATVAVVAVFVVLVVGGYLLSRRQSRRLLPGATDQVTEDVVTGLMTELRKWQAEAAHWKGVAQRLQREIDQK
jgi:hypothetical protein